MNKSLTLTSLLVSVIILFSPGLLASGGHYGKHFERGHGHAWGHNKGHGHGWGHYKKHYRPDYYAPPRHYYRPVEHHYWSPPAHYHKYHTRHHHHRSNLPGILGGALGGTVGGIAGHEFSGGNPIATGVGAAAGAIIGREIVD